MKYQESCRREHQESLVCAGRDSGCANVLWWPLRPRAALPKDSAVSGPQLKPLVCSSTTRWIESNAHVVGLMHITPVEPSCWRSQPAEPVGLSPCPGDKWTEPGPAQLPPVLTCLYWVRTCFISLSLSCTSCSFWLASSKTSCCILTTFMKFGAPWGLSGEPACGECRAASKTQAGVGYWCPLCLGK